MSFFGGGRPSPESIQDLVADLLQEGTNITLDYNDSANSLTINMDGVVLDPTNVQLLDSKMDNINGFDYTDHKNEFGYTDDTHFSACYPIKNPSYSVDARFDEAWTISPLNTVVYHGCSPFDDFGVDGVPARPDSNTGYAMGVWCNNPNLHDEAVRLEHGLDIATIRQWYHLGYKTWNFSVYFAALPYTADIMQQNLTNPTGQDVTGFVNWEPTTPPCPKNLFKFRIVDILGSEVIAKTTLLNYTVDSDWHLVTYSFTLDDTHEKYMRKQGADGLQLQLIFGNEGHPRHLIYNPTLSLDSSDFTGSGGSSSEQIQDVVADLLVAGDNITLTYDDTGNTLTIDAAGGSLPSDLINLDSIILGGNTIPEAPTTAIEKSGMGVFMDGIDAGDSNLYTTANVFIGNYAGSPAVQVQSIDTFQQGLFLPGEISVNDHTTVGIDGNYGSFLMSANPSGSFISLGGGTAGNSSINITVGFEQPASIVLQGDGGPSTTISANAGSTFGNHVDFQDTVTCSSTLQASGLITNADITANRPASPTIGQFYFDTTLGKPIFYSGSDWVLADGTVV